MDSALQPLERLSRKSLEVERLERENADLRAELFGKNEQLRAVEANTQNTVLGWMETANGTIARQREQLNSMNAALARSLAENDRLRDRLLQKPCYNRAKGGIWKTSALAVSAILGAAIMAAIMAAIL